MTFRPETYIESVLSGQTLACQFVKQACQRHLSDLQTGHERGLYFDEKAAQHAIDFFKFLKHSKGEWAGQAVTLEDWQKFVIAMIFGWKRADGTRRFRSAYLEVARKNGKSTLAAGIGLYLLVADGEAGAEIYSAATHRDQARITHSEAVRMVKSSPHLRSRVSTYKDNLLIKGTAAKFVPLGRDADSLDGLNLHGALVDELHAHPTRDLLDILDTARGSRRQPLLFMITTAGHDRQSVCYEQHSHVANILAGTVQDDSYFGLIFTLDEGDDWEDPANWIKANPNLGVSKKADYMAEQAAKAKSMPSALNAFLRLELNVWTQAESRWLSVDHWQACGDAVDANDLRGRTCYAGLDLSSTQDITAFVLVFPGETKDDKWRVLCRFWVPEEAMHNRSKKDRVPYEAWVTQGFISTTPGQVIDYDYILAQIKKDAADFDLQEVAFDRWGAAKLTNDLQKEDITVVQFGQGYASMNAPMKELERMILEHKIAHGNNPVLTWMAGNLVASEDPAGNIKPDKAKSTEKIDGMVALVMALDRATRHAEPTSVYETRGIRLI